MLKLRQLGLLVGLLGTGESPALELARGASVLPGNFSPRIGGVDLLRPWRANLQPDELRTMMRPYVEAQAGALAAIVARFMVLGITRSHALPNAGRL